MQEQPLRVAEAWRFLQCLKRVALRGVFGIAPRIQQARQFEMRFRRVGRVEQQHFSISLDRLIFFPQGDSRQRQRPVRRGDQRVDGQQALGIFSHRFPIFALLGQFNQAKQQADEAGFLFREPLERGPFRVGFV